MYISRYRNCIAVFAKINVITRTGLSSLFNPGLLNKEKQKREIQAEEKESAKAQKDSEQEGKAEMGSRLCSFGNEEGRTG